MITEASRKANKLHVMHAAKLIGKIPDNEERERQAKDLEKKAKKMGLSRKEVEEILDKQGAWGDEYTMVKSADFPPDLVLTQPGCRAIIIIFVLERS